MKVVVVGGGIAGVSAALDLARAGHEVVVIERSERIRDTIRRLDTAHPPLAAHLREAVRTGATCSYEPATPVAWSL